VKTVLTTSPEEAAGFIKQGRVAAFPTETVYGLGADVFDEKAITRIFEAKRRPADNPLIAHIGDISQIGELTAGTNSSAQKFIERFFPGPLTLVLPKSKNVPLIAAAGLDTIGVRMPGNDLAREFLKACGVPVVAPSANLSGRPSPTTWQAVYEDLDGRIDCILQGETTEIGLESTVVDCSGERPLVLRTGAVTVEQLREVVPETEVYRAREEDPPRSPGMKHRHYSPRAKVFISPRSKVPGPKSADSPESHVLGPGLNAAFIGLNLPNDGFELVKICNSVEDYAHSLFEFFRECDRQGIDTIYCETVQETGIGAALMDRLRRAAE
jgi:L-threonylcarbamoyladenylate synthase